MSNLNLNFKEIGQVIRVNVGKDITASIPSIRLTPEYGIKKETASGVTIGTEDITVDNEEWFANEYIEYTTVKDDLDYVGRWKKKAILTFSADNVEQTDYVKFRVMP